MSDKREGPYRRLQRIGKEWAAKIRFRHEFLMWRYPKEKLKEGWNLDQLAERVAAAQQLGYEVILVKTDDGLSVKYRKQIPDIPWEFQ